MKPHTDFPGLAQLPGLLHTNRRLVAGQLRVTADEKKSREDMAALMTMAAPDITAITCACVTGGKEHEYELRKYVSERDGKTRVKVIKRR
jgi:hypothetical protein